MEWIKLEETRNYESRNFAYLDELAKNIPFMLFSCNASKSLKDRVVFVERREDLARLAPNLCVNSSFSHYCKIDIPDAENLKMEY